MILGELTITGIIVIGALMTAFFSLGVAFGVWMKEMADLIDEEEGEE